MLHDFFKRWNDCVNSRVPTDTICDKAGRIVEQRAQFKYSDREIQVYARVSSECIDKPDNEWKWIAEFYCPSTGKFLANKKRKSIIDCAMDIRDLVSSDSNRTATLAIREAKRKQQQTVLCTLNHMSRLTTETTFSPEVITAIVEVLKPTNRHPKAQWNDYALDAVIKMHKSLLAPIVYTEGDEASSIDDIDPNAHIKRMYALATVLRAHPSTDVFGNRCIPISIAKKEFLYRTDNLPFHVRLVRMNYARLYELVRNTSKMMIIIDILCAMYEKITGITPAAAYEREMADRTRRQKQRQARSAGQNGNTVNKSVSVVTEFKPVENTIGQIFGDVLDIVQRELANDPINEPIKEPGKEKGRMKPKTKKKPAYTADEEKIKPLKSKKTEAAKAKKVPIPDLGDEQSEYAVVPGVI